MIQRNDGEEISWQEHRTSAPDRPVFASSLAPEKRIERPKRLRGVVACFWTILVCALAIIGVALVLLDEIQGDMVSALPDDLKADYSVESIERAAAALIGAFGAVLLALLTLAGLSLHAFVGRRSLAARTTYVVTATALIPTLALCVILTPFTVSITCGAAAAIALATSIVLCFGNSVTRWLRQSEERRRILIAGEP